jgi:subtilisin-like proprotein convertase family protein
MRRLHFLCLLAALVVTPFLAGNDSCAPVPVDPAPTPADPAACASTTDCDDGLVCRGIPQYMEGGEGCCLDLAAVPGAGAACSDDADCDVALLCIGDQCQPEWMAGSFTSAPGAAIPSGDPAGVSDTIVVRCLASVPVDVRADIRLLHSTPSDLRATISDPSGDVVTEITLPAASAAGVVAVDDVRVLHTGDDAVNGPWTLQVVDSAAPGVATIGVGAITEWTLHVTSRWD